MLVRFVRFRIDPAELEEYRKLLLDEIEPVNQALGVQAGRHAMCSSSPSIAEDGNLSLNAPDDLGGRG